MRIIFKILAAPFVLVLTLLVAVLSFLLSLSAGLLSILASVLGLLSVLMLFVEKDISTGIAGLLMAFAISPFGLPALALWPACAGRMAACQAGRAERLSEGLHHGLSSGHGGQKMQKTAADPSRRLSYGKEGCLRPQPTSNLTSGPISGRPCKA